MYIYIHTCGRKRMYFPLEIYIHIHTDVGFGIITVGFNYTTLRVRVLKSRVPLDLITYSII